MNNRRKIIVISGAVACLAACVGDFLFTFLLGSRYPGYSQVFDVMSFLGSSESPVSDLISFWWVILGFLILIFAAGFRAAFEPGNNYTKLTFWLIVIYGLGEGMGSGLFKADIINNSVSTSFLIHDILGGAGVFAILILPLAAGKVHPFSANQSFRRFSRVVLASGTLFFILFSLRFAGVVNVFPVKYTGLWQRLFIFDYYVYLLVIAFIMTKTAAVGRSHG